ncbi:nucleotide exchange factor GrpE [Yinghuangia aomiensis]
MDESLYTLLGVTPDADAKAVHAAYARAITRHRDRRQEITQARQELLRNRLEHDVLYYFDPDLPDDPAAELGDGGDLLDPRHLPPLDLDRDVPGVRCGTRPRPPPPPAAPARAAPALPAAGPGRPAGAAAAAVTASGRAAETPRPTPATDEESPMSDPLRIDEQPRPGRRGEPPGVDLYDAFARLMERRATLESPPQSRNATASRADTPRTRALGLLDVCDALDQVLLRQLPRELSGVSAAVDKLRDNLEATQRLMQRNLARLGVTRMRRSNVADPERCDIVAVEDRAGLPEDTILAEVTAGYWQDGAVLRRARVVVESAARHAPGNPRRPGRPGTARGPPLFRGARTAPTARIPRMTRKDDPCSARSASTSAPPTP